MALNIKDPETDRLARELAKRMDTSITNALRVALEERLKRTRRPSDPDRLAAILAIGRKGRSRPILDGRPEEEILGYDENGIPT